MTVEEALLCQRHSSGFLMEARGLFGKWDPIMFPRGANDVAQEALVLSMAPLYVWLNPMKHLVDASAPAYPLEQALEAMHYFHQPTMLWLFEEPVLRVVAPIEQQQLAVDKVQGIDAVLIVPVAVDGLRTPQQWLQHALSYQDATAEERERMRQELVERATGVQFTAFASVKSRVPLPMPLGQSIPSGSRVMFPVMTAQMKFGQPGTVHDVVDSQLTDPTIDDEQATLKRWVLSAAALLKQRLFVATPQLATRAERKRLDKLALPTAVLTIQLRATEHVRGTGEHGVVEWASRWIVRGHWRNQWYASQGEHRIVWIPPYIKGPEERPLVVRPAVYAVAR